MAVFTELSRADIDALLTDNELDALVDYTGVEEGTENTTYLVDGARARYVVSVFERWVEPQDIPFFVDLLTRLSDTGVPCPRPVTGGDGRAITSVAGRPALVTSFLPGRPVDDPAPEACRGCGRVLADIHRVTEGMDSHRPNMLSLTDWYGLLDACGTRLDSIADGLHAELARALDRIAAAWPGDALPRGVIHGDLFPDNLFFASAGAATTGGPAADPGADDVSGVIDFFFAAQEVLAYDLAVSLVSWAFDGRGRFEPARARAMIAGYGERRTLSPAEAAGLPVLTQGAALRFTLTRAYDWLNPKPDARIRPKDPLAMMPRLRLFLDQPRAIADACG
ncbi:homoserine kinase [Rhodothalassium salexigens]|uniref:homoserine kinase n=1 Tax=Rhodothalassium salexigens TaxID=1086 RepID=UPI001911F3DD|nr:homoserine kinase [Rhodothalassium salexigens]MBK5921711.1 homoserine kinase [Rhodothalassium salexigens]